MQGPVGKLADVATGVPGVATPHRRAGKPLGQVADHDDPPGRHIEVRLAVALHGHDPLEAVR
ncbi:hypothetical protein OHT51_41830 [Streptomyces sp. NBC_00299]